MLCKFTWHSAFLILEAREVREKIDCLVNSSRLHNTYYYMYLDSVWLQTQENLECVGGKFIAQGDRK